MAFTWVCPDCTTDNYSESVKPADVDCAECGGEFVSLRGCDIEFGEDHEHDDEHCAWILSNMNSPTPDERFWEVDEFGQPVYNTDY